MTDSADPVVLSQVLELTDCDRKGTVRNVPLGYWTHEEVDVLVQRRGWETEDYAVKSVGPSAVVERVVTALRR